MFKLQAADPAALALGGASAAGSWATLASQITTEWLGVPVPVVLAAIAGACVARAYLQPIGFLSASWRVLAWAALACFLAPLARAIGSKLLGVELPNNVLASMAGLVSTAAAWPLLVAYLRAEFPGLASRFLGSKSKGGGNGSA